MEYIRASGASDQSELQRAGRSVVLCSPEHWSLDHRSMEGAERPARFFHDCTKVRFAAIHWSASVVEVLSTVPTARVASSWATLEAFRWLWLPVWSSVAR